MGRDEGGTLAGLKAHRRDLIDPKIDEYGGRIVKTTGDGLLLEFPSIVDAVRCAVELQRGMIERNAEVPEEERIRFRVGINVGDVIIDDNDIFGDGVNVAARLQTLAEPGGICVSRAVRDQVLDKLSFRFEDLGAQTVKNIARPVEVYRIRDEPTSDAVTDARPVPGVDPLPTRRSQSTTWRWLAAGAFSLGFIGIGAWSLSQRSQTGTTPVPPPLSVAVLPFAAAGGNRDDDQIAAALTRDLTTNLSRWRWATVASVNKAPDSRAKEFDARIVGRELNVRYLVDGELRRGSDKDAITIHLIDTRSGANAWSDRLEFDLLRPPEEQPAPAVRLARRLRTAIYETEMRRAAASPVPGSAWDLVLRGDAALNAGNDRVTDARDARKLYDEALRIDPSFVPALLSIPNAVLTVMYNDPDADRSRFVQELDELDKLTTRAVSVDPKDASAWYIRSNVLVELRRLEEALAADAKAEALDPFNATFTAQHAAIALMLDQPDEALALAERAMSLDRGLLGEEGFSLRMVCEANFLLGRYSEAMPACEKAAVQSNLWGDQAWLVAGYTQQGDLTRASVAKAELLKRQPGFTIERFKAEEASAGSAGYLRRLEMHVLVGLRKAGLADKKLP